MPIEEVGRETIKQYNLEFLATNPTIHLRGFYLIGYTHRMYTLEITKAHSLRKL